MSDLKKRVERLESELGVEGPVFDSPADWSWDHLFVFEDASESGFSLGYDENGDPIIRHDRTGHVACVDPEQIGKVLGDAAKQKEDSSDE